MNVCTDKPGGTELHLEFVCVRVALCRVHIDFKLAPTVRKKDVRARCCSVGNSLR